MENRSYTLLVFEGEKTEKQIFESLKKYFFQKDNSIIYGIYANNIYNLYKQIKSDEYLDLFMLLKENKKNRFLEDINRENIAEIYLFFDYDRHDTKADDKIVDNIIKLFDNETEYGKIYINYPMVESIRHISNTTLFKDSTCSILDKNYKNIVHKESDNKYIQTKKYSEKLWYFVIELHLKKANYLVSNIFEFKNLVSQEEIFEKQIDNCSNLKQIYILSSIPLFIADWYGFELFVKMLGDKK